eukprot:3487856-Prymnesium_polylepis.1
MQLQRCKRWHEGRPFERNCGGERHVLPIGRPNKARKVTLGFVPCLKRKNPPCKKKCRPVGKRNRPFEMPRIHRPDPAPTAQTQR